MVWWHHPNVVSRVIPRSDTTVDVVVVVVAVSDSPNDTADTAADADTDTDDDDDEHHYFRYYGHLPPSWSRWPS